jgi:CheY-like chemotaxis protein
MPEPPPLKSPPPVKPPPRNEFQVELVESPSDVRTTILCVDDEEPGLVMRKLVLESAGYRVLVATSVRDAIRLFESERIDAAILDYFMPDMNGLALAQKLRASNRTLPIIILSAYAPLPDETLGIADLWLRKAQEGPEQVLAHLKELLKRRMAA